MVLKDSKNRPYLLFIHGTCDTFSYRELVTKENYLPPILMDGRLPHVWCNENFSDTLAIGEDCMGQDYEKTYKKYAERYASVAGFPHATLLYIGKKEDKQKVLDTFPEKIIDLQPFYTVVNFEELEF